MRHLRANSTREEIGARTSVAARVLIALRISQSWLKEKAVKLPELSEVSAGTGIRNLSKVLLILFLIVRWRNVDATVDGSQS